MDEESTDDPGLKKMVEATEKMDEAKEKMDEATEKMDEATEKMVEATEKMEEAKEEMDEAKEKMDEAKEKIHEATEKTEEGLSTLQLDENKTERALTDEKVSSIRQVESKTSEGGEGGGEGALKEPAEKKRFVSVRKYFGRKEDIMIVDALTTGNIGEKVLIESDFLGDFSQIVRIFRVLKWILIFNLDESLRFFFEVEGFFLLLTSCTM